VLSGFILQVQLLLAALSAVLPLAPEKNRAHLAHVLETIAAALKLGETAAGAGAELATKFAALRSEVEEMAALSTTVSAEQFEAAFERVRVASTALGIAATPSAPR
jgi:hypothetical protein